MALVYKLNAIGKIALASSINAVAHKARPEGWFDEAEQAAESFAVGLFTAYVEIDRSFSDSGVTVVVPLVEEWFDMELVE